MSVRLWLVRHGATEWSEAGRICGWTDVPLSPRGEDQAANVGRRVAGQEFDGVWTSDLSRASVFAAIAWGGAEGDQRLRELDFGRLEGMRWEECDSMTFAALMRFDGFVAPGGESTDQLRARVHEFLEGLPGGRHLIVTHGGVIRLLSREAGQPVSPLPGGMTILEWPAPALSTGDRRASLT
jgi:probable phosphoglycerate mutase